MQEPKARESLLTPGMQERKRSTSSASRNSNTTIDTTGKTTLVDTASIISAKSESESISATAEPLTPLVHQLASTTIMERTPFAIDEAKEDEDVDDDLDSLDGVEGDEDKFMMDEVDAFLEEHDSGLTGAENAAAKGKPSP